MTFSGGTSLSKAWGLIKRFSEDIDFKVAEPAGASASRARRERTAYRARVLGALSGAGFELIGEPYVRDLGRFFSADLAYDAEFTAGEGFARISALKCLRGAGAARRLGGRSTR